MTRQYYPSNGTEGDLFIEKYCAKCYKYSQCLILFNAVVGIQPMQWVYENDDPVCKAFSPSRPKVKASIPGQLSLTILNITV
jgi:hypothetical protein